MWAGVYVDLVTWSPWGWSRFFGQTPSLLQELSLGLQSTQAESGQFPLLRLLLYPSLLLQLYLYLVLLLLLPLLLLLMLPVAAEIVTVVDPVLLLHLVLVCYCGGSYCCWRVGWCVFVGLQETRASMNASQAKTKVGLFDLEVNLMSKILFGLLCLLSLSLVALRGFEGIWFIYFCRFILLLSSIIPISLQVNLIIAKTIHSLNIMRDKKMKGAVSTRF